AHGYARVTGRPLAVALHANVGLMHATMAIFNAWCDRIPMLMLGGVGPMDAVARRPWVDWIHTSSDMAALVRDYTKWDDQPASVAPPPPPPAARTLPGATRRRSTGTGGGGDRRRARACGAPADPDRPRRERSRKLRAPRPARGAPKRPGDP